MTMRKIVAIVAAMLMLLSVMPIAAFAADDTYELVTNVNDLAAGDTIIIVAKKANYAISTTQNSNNRAQAAVTKDGNTISNIGNTVQVLTLENGKTTGTFAFNTGKGYLYAASSSKNYLRTETTMSANSSWNITIADTGVATIKATGSNTRNWLRYNSSNNPPIFSCYGSGQTDVSIYKLATGGSDEPVCEHEKLECGAECPVCGEYTNPNEHTYVDGGKFDTVCDNCGKTRPFPEPEADSELTIAEVLELGAALGGQTTNKYYVSGTIVDVYNTTYGNLNLTDGTDTCVVYGLYSKDGSVRYDAMTVKPIAGDTITVYGAVGVYQGKGQVASGWLVEHEQTGCQHHNAVYDHACKPTVCPDCNTELPATAEHAYVEDVIDATCTDAGKVTYTCSVCNDSYTEVVPVIPHNYVDGKCDVCGAEKPDGYTPITSADQFVSGQYVLVVDTGYAPTYFDADSSWVLTNKPEIVDNVIADATGYLWTLTVDGNSVVITDANGVTIAPKGGNNNGIKSGEYTWNWSFADGKFIFAGVGTDTVYLASNATAGSGDNKFRGYKQTTCAGTSYSYKFTLYAASTSGSDEPECEHQWNAATCTEPATCALCGAKEGEALGHNYVADIIDATCTTAGSATYECSVCFDSYDETIPVKPHNYVDDVCADCGYEKPAGCTPIISADEFVSGQYVLVVESGYAPTYVNDASSPWLLCGKPEVVDGVIADATGFLFTVTVDGNTVKIQDANGNFIAPKGGDSNGIKKGDYTWNWSFENGKFIFAGVDSDTVYLASNTTKGDTQNQFRGYKQTTCTGAPEQYLHKFVLYKSSVKNEPVCEHEYDNACDVDCNLCYETREVEHSVKHVEAKAATCNATGNIEYWYCDVCGMAWLDEACTMNTNLRAVNLPMAEHVYFDDCSAICEVCGYEREVSHNIVHVEAVAPTCNAMGNIEYWYCDVCGMAWLDEACTMNTNLRAVNLPMADEHTYDDDYDTDCNVCGAIREIDMPVDTIYGDADGNGAVEGLDAAIIQQYLAGWDVTVDEVAADADGNGAVEGLDAAIIQQYLAGWDVTLGPATESEDQQFNDAGFGSWPS